MPTLRDLLHDCHRAVIFTGAGISTESGIPDFRSPGGVWTRMQPIYFKDFLASPTVRQQAWQRRFDNVDGWVGASPNAGHLAVAQLIHSGRASVVITQNVDGLHQQSGVPAERIIEIHGNATYASCLDCHLRYELDELERQFRRDGEVAPCTACGGIIKTATISFGQPMPVERMQQAQEATLACDLFLVLGSSLSVFPAADLPALAKQQGARLVIINRDPTPLDGIADLVIHDGIGATLQAALA